MRNLATVAFVLCLVSPGAAIHAHFGRLPVHFEANRGQTDPEVRYLARTPAFTLGITRSGASVALGADSQVRMKLEGSASHPVIEPLGKLPGVSNYFLGPDPSRWLRNIPQYSAVKLNRIYKGIDLVFYGNARQLEYDFMVAPGIDPSVIRFQLEGASSIALDPGGDLILNTPGGELRHKRPIAYQGSGNRRISVEVRYRLRGRSVSFDVGRYNPREPLIIDPTLAYASYLGGSGGDYGHAIAVDSTGAAYIAGETYSLNFPGRSPDNEAIGRAFVTKINAAGTAIVYSTVFGGARTEAYSLAVDAEGAAYFSGLTFGGIPLRNPFQAQYGGNGDLFVAKLNPAGSDLVYSTYVGGSGIEGGQNRGALRIDSTGAVYVAGQTRSADFPVRNAFQSNLRGSSDAVVFNLNPAGTDLVFSTYLGGSGEEVFSVSLALDASNRPVVAGSTESNDFPLRNQLQSVRRGTTDIFLTKFNTAGNDLVFSTYLGGNGSDGSSAVAVDSTGSVYLAGQSASTDIIVAGNFLAKLDGDGQNLSFPLNSFGWWIRSIATDGSGNIYLTGGARSGLPLVRAYWTTPPGNNSDDDAFITKLSSSGSILYSTYFGGFRATGEAIAADAAGAAYIAGSTSSAAGIEEIPVTNAFQPQSDGADAFVAKILDSPDTRLVSVTVTAGPPNTGLSVSVDGQTTSVPRTFRWLAGSTHTISTTRVQGGSPLRFTFLNWSDGGGLSHSITVPSTDITYIANFQPEIQLVTDVFPNGRGSISVSPSSSDGFYPLNTNLTLTATAAPGFFFTGWAGALSGTTNPRTLQLAYNFQQPITTVIANFGTAPPIGGVSLGFVPVTPCRLVDTRPGEGRSGGFGPPLIAGGTTRDIPVTQGVCNIPAAARAYSLNVTVVPARPLSFLTIYPTGQQRPDVSTLNAFEGQIVANAAIVPAGTNGSISIFATDDTHVIVDINGYFTNTSDSLSFYTLAPCRLIDTRTGSGGPGGEFGPPSFPANTSRTFNIPASNCNVPANARAYVTNFTVVPKGPLSYIATWPTGAERPLVSTLNSLQGRVLANAAIVPAGTNGAINIFSSNDTDIVVDISGYFAPPGGVNALRFYALNPCRLVDTRQSQILGAQQTRTFSMRGDCGAPITAAAFSLNTTVAPPDYLGFLTLFPSSGSRPFVSTLNAWEGQVPPTPPSYPAVKGRSTPMRRI